MNELNLNIILNRKEKEEKIIESLNHFELNKSKLLTKRGIYIYGSPGSGKTSFVKNILKKMNYDVVMYDAGDVRNKTVIDTITKHNMSDKNVLSMFHKKIKKIAIMMDEIDGMNNGDKGGINSLIKLMRPKKTNKQKKEDTTMIPIICIGNYHMDKKIKEMMKICTTIELPQPTNLEIKTITNILMPTIDDTLSENIVDYIEGDLRKVKSIYNIYKNHEEILKNNLIHQIFQKKNYNENTKDITGQLLTNYFKLNKHNFIMNETDRTSVGLLFHENIIDYLDDKDSKKNINKYKEVLENFVFSDYIDRITFQKQIWIFNEMTSLIKTMHNNLIFHDEGIKRTKKQPIRFTKVLTKYSTEYNNIIFIQTLCNKLVMEKKDLFTFFIHLRKTKDVEEIFEYFSNENYDISKLDISRLYRYIDKYNKNYMESDE